MRFERLGLNPGTSKCVLDGQERIRRCRNALGRAGSESSRVGASGARGSASHPRSAGKALIVGGQSQSIQWVKANEFAPVERFRWASTGALHRTLALPQGKCVSA